MPAPTARSTLVAWAPVLLLWVLALLLLHTWVPSTHLAGAASDQIAQQPRPLLEPPSQHGSDSRAKQMQQRSQQLQQRVRRLATQAAAAGGSAAGSSGVQANRLLQQQQQQGAVAGSRTGLQDTATLSAAAAVAPPLPSSFSIPVPPPGQNIPAEPLVPLYSPDQLRLRLPVLPDVPLDGQIISLMEQMQQAAHLNRTLTNEQLQNANPLLGKHGILKTPDRTDPKQYPEGYVAICAIVKNQHQDLREWLEYHKWLGVGKVYVYDNNSTEPLLPDIIDMVQQGYVEYSFFTGMPRYRDLFRTSSQWWAYNDCVTRFRHRHRWLAFIDADEFIVLHDAAGTDNINDFMRGFDQYGGLALNWVVFGSSAHKQRPHGGVLVNYRQCLPLQQEQNQHVKVVANTAHLMTVGDDPHRVYYNDMKRFGTVNELGAPVPGPKSPPSHSKVALYHYLTKSEGEYMQKMRRGSAAGNYKSPEFFTAINGLATETCTRAVPLGLKCCPSVVRELGADGVARVRAAIAADQAAAAGAGAGAGGAAAAAIGAGAGGDAAGR